MTSNLRRISLCLTLVTAVTLLISCGGSGGGSDSSEPEAPATPTEAPAGRAWTVEEILSEPRIGGGGGEAKCGGEFGFRRCVCPESVPFTVRYRPAVVECNNNAAAILDGPYLDAFSVVVRDTQNRDRWPAAGSGFGGCSAELADSESPPNYCSAFKVQSKFPIAAGTALVHCFGASGYSDIFADASRLTIKNSDNPFSNDDDIDRYCLIAGDQPLN